MTNTARRLKPLFGSLVLAITLAPLGADAAADHDAEVVRRAAINAQGGEQALRALRNVEFSAVGYRSMVEQSERARGVPAYAVDLNRTILERVIGDRRASKPDALSRAPRRPRFHFVSARTLVGDGSIASSCTRCGASPASGR